MKKDSVWVIIPAFNEGKRIREVIIEARKFPYTLVVVDDGSSDDTGEIAGREGVILLTHLVNMGKGAALKTGCDYAFKNGAEVMVVLDADGQHKPDDIKRFLEKIGEGNDVVFGYREGLSSMPSILKFGNWFISKTIHLLYGIDIIDSQSGYRAFTGDAYRRIRWKANDYSMESEMIANLGKARLRFDQIPIPTIYLDSYKGTTIKDGVKIVVNMVFWRFSR